MTVSIDRAWKTVNLKGTVFGEHLSDDKYIEALCPDTPSDLKADLLDAAGRFGFSKDVKGMNEHKLFKQQYMQVKQVVYREAGLAGLKLYERYQPIVEAAVLRASNVGDVTGNFLGAASTSGAEEWVVRQIQEDTFGMTGGDRIYTTGGIGTFHVIPRGAVGASPGTYNTTNDKQMLLVFYYQNDLNPRVVENIQESSNDAIGNRCPFGAYSQMQRGNEGVITRPGCLVIDDNKNVDIDAHVLQNADVDLMPQGIEVNTRGEVTELIQP